MYLNENNPVLIAIIAHSIQHLSYLIIIWTKLWTFIPSRYILYPLQTVLTETSKIRSVCSSQMKCRSFTWLLRSVSYNISANIEMSRHQIKPQHIMRYDPSVEVNNSRWYQELTNNFAAYSTKPNHRPTISPSHNAHARTITKSVWLVLPPGERTAYSTEQVRVNKSFLAMRVRVYTKDIIFTHSYK